MKFMTNILVAIAASLTLLAGSALASDSTASVANPSASSPTVSSDVVEVIYDVRYVETKARKKRRKKNGKSIRVIRDNAIESSLNGIKRLKPYTTNYNRLKSAVRSYWRRNVRRPTTNGLARTMMRYVKRNKRDKVRSRVYAGAQRGVAKVKRQLRRR